MIENLESVLARIKAELERATTKFPTWPTDPLHALAVLGEEVGELNKEMLQLVYEPHKSSMGAVEKEAIQAAAMAVRLIMSLDRYTYRPGDQHSQGPSAPGAGPGEGGGGNDPGPHRNPMLPDLPLRPS